MACSSSEWDLSDAVELVPNRLYWITLNSTSMPRNTSRSHYFSVDRALVYEPFFHDFGPLHLGHTYRYCKMLDDKLKDPKLAGSRLIHCCSASPKKRTNAAYLICAYMVVVHRQSADIAFEPFNYVYPALLGYRDATATQQVLFELSVLDCLRGLEASIRAKLFDWERFNAESYEFFSKVENGDANWILPDKFLAFAGPYPTSTDEDGYRAFMPEDYVPIFLDAGIRLVIRLNRKIYDKQKFMDHGIKHVDLYFADGTCPSGDTINRFLRIAESERGPCAVHCKAGLGRTGTLIGLYAMKHYRIPARSFIGWNRICRPGSILGPQQQFLVDMEQAMFQAGEFMRPLPASIFSAGADTAHLEKRMARLTVRDLAEEERVEDVGQGEGLCKAKRSFVADPAFLRTGQAMPNGAGAGQPGTGETQHGNGFAPGVSSRKPHWVYASSD